MKAEENREEIAKYIYEQLSIYDENIAIYYDIDNKRWLVDPADAGEDDDTDFYGHKSALGDELGITLYTLIDTNGRVPIWNKEKESEYEKTVHSNN